MSDMTPAEFVREVAKHCGRCGKQMHPSADGRLECWECDS